MLNKGLTGIEIAEDFPLPDALDSAWHARGYYGSVSHNVKAIYQRYLGWFDGNPTLAVAAPAGRGSDPVRRGHRWREAILAKAAEYADKGDLRFAAELLKHAVFDDPADEAGKNALADVYERLGYGAENATWRSFYLAGAEELRKGVQPLTISDLGAGMAGALTVEQLFDTLAIRIDGPKAADAQHRHRLELHRRQRARAPVALERCPDPDTGATQQGRGRPHADPDQGAAARADGGPGPRRHRAVR